MRDYVALADQYIDDVLAARISACKWVRLACERQRRDLARAQANDPAFPYLWNPELTRTRGHRAGKAYRPAASICAFIELMPHVKGKWGDRGERIRLEPWQCFFLTTLFGWTHRTPDPYPIELPDGRTVHRYLRRFRKADLYVPRKNAKSTIAAGIGNYMHSADEEFGAEVYSGATSQKQALEVFTPARLMANASPEYRAAFSVLVNAGSIIVTDTNSKFEPLIGKPGDGASPSCSITDEYHEHPTSEQYDTMVTGMGARSQPLALVITTSGTNIGGPAYEHQASLEKILDGIVTDERRFGVIYGLDKGDDWTKPEALVKANPNLGVSIDAEALAADQAEAARDPRKSSTFRTKRLNVWVGAASPWLNVTKLLAAVDPELTRKAFRGERCDIGLDLASKQDIASKMDLFQRDINGKTHWYLFSKHYVPEAAVLKRENEHYRGWLEAGDLVQTPGNMIDIDAIGEDVEATAEHHVVGQVGIDSWGSAAIAPALQQAGFTVVDVPMTTRHLSEPMKLIAALIDAGRFHIAPNAATVWMFSNVEAIEDRNENIFPRKPGGSAPKAHLKIDAAVATIIAMSRALAAQPAQEVGVFFV
jgi:phage terminase large subunit-like protein